MDEQRLLNIRLQMEVLITEREGMIALNKHRDMQGYSQAYGEDAFLRVQEAFQHLVNATR